MICCLEKIGDIFPDALIGGYAVPRYNPGIIRNRARLFTASVLKSMTEIEENATIRPEAQAGRPACVFIEGWIENALPKNV